MMGGWKEESACIPVYFNFVQLLAYPSCWLIYPNDFNLHLDSGPLVLGTGLSGVLLAPCVGMLHVFLKVPLWTIGGREWRLPRVIQTSRLGIYNKEINAKSVVKRADSSPEQCLKQTLGSECHPVWRTKPRNMHIPNRWGAHSIPDTYWDPWIATLKE